MVYCIIRGPPPFGMQQGRLSLFALHTSQDQFVAEGLIMGVRWRCLELRLRLLLPLWGGVYVCLCEKGWTVSVVPTYLPAIPIPIYNAQAINLMAGLSLVSAYYFASKAHYRLVQFVGAFACLQTNKQTHTNTQTKRIPSDTPHIHTTMAWRDGNGDNPALSLTHLYLPTLATPHNLHHNRRAQRLPGPGRLLPHAALRLLRAEDALVQPLRDARPTGAAFGRLHLSIVGMDCGAGWW